MPIPRSPFTWKDYAIANGLPANFAVTNPKLAAVVRSELIKLGYEHVPKHFSGIGVRQAWALSREEMKLPPDAFDPPA
jgi:hypothetical protein